MPSDWSTAGLTRFRSRLPSPPIIHSRLVLDALGIDARGSVVLELIDQETILNKPLPDLLSILGKSERSEQEARRLYAGLSEVKRAILNEVLRSYREDFRFMIWRHWTDCIEAQYESKRVSRLMFDVGEPWGGHEGLMLKHRGKSREVTVSNALSELQTEGLIERYDATKSLIPKASKKKVAYIKITPLGGAVLNVGIQR